MPQARPTLSEFSGGLPFCLWSEQGANVGGIPRFAQDDRILIYSIEGAGNVHRFTRVALIAIGIICVALGVVGMFVPVLPTTPFLLLAAACFARSSERFSRWLLTNRWCGEYIRNYREGRGMLLGQKILTLLLLWLTIGGTVWLTALAWWGDVLLVGVAVGVTAHLIHIKTYQPANQPENQLRPPCMKVEPDASG